MNGIGIAEQVVHVAQNFLVRTNQKRAHVIVVAGEGVQRERALHVAPVDELIHLAIGVARDIAKHRRVRRPLVQPVDRHDREQLLDRPAIRHALEQREITEVRVGERRLKRLQFFR